MKLPPMAEGIGCVDENVWAKAVWHVYSGARELSYIQPKPLISYKPKLLTSAHEITRWQVPEFMSGYFFTDEETYCRKSANVQQAECMPRLFLPWTLFHFHPSRFCTCECLLAHAMCSSTVLQGRQGVFRNDARRLFHCSLM